MEKKAACGTSLLCRCVRIVPDAEAGRGCACLYQQYFFGSGVSGTVHADGKSTESLFCGKKKKMDSTRAFWDIRFLLYDHRRAAGYQGECSFYRSFDVACHPCRGSGNDIVCPVFLGSDRWEAKGAGSEPSERGGSHRSGGKAME